MNGGDTPDSTNKIARGRHKRRDPQAGNTAKGIRKSHERCRIEKRKVRPSRVRVRYRGYGTSRARETATNDPRRAGVNRDINQCGVGATHGKRKAEKPQGRELERGRPASGGAPRERVERRSGMVRRLAASDSAARPANVEGNRNLKRGGPDRTDCCFALTGKETAAGQPTRPGQGGRPRPARTSRRTCVGRFKGFTLKRNKRTPEPVGHVGQTG